MKKSASGTRLYQAAVMLFWFSQYTYVPHLSAYLKDLGASLTLIGIVTGSYGFTQMLARIPLGILSDRIGKRKLFVCLGIFLSFAANMLFLLVRSDFLLVTARGTAGLGAASWVIITVLFSSYFPAEETTQAISRLSAVNNLGRLLGMLIAGAALAVFSGYSSMFAIGAASAALAFILSLFIQEKIPENRTPMTLKGFVSVIRDRRLLCMACAMLIGQLYIAGMVTGFTPLLATGLGASSFLRSILSVTDIAMGLIGALLAGRAGADGAGEKKYLFCSAAALSILTVCIAFSPNLPVLFVLQALAGLFSGILTALTMSLAIRHFPGDRRSTAMGCYQAIYGIGMFVGPILVGRCADLFGMKSGYFLVAAILLLIIPLSAAWARKELQSSKRENKERADGCGIV